MKNINKQLEQAAECHEHYYKFFKWLQRTYGKDLFGEPEFVTIGKRKIKLPTFDRNKLATRLVGYDAIVKIERYVKRYIPVIKILHCDDAVYASSIILLIPHPKHGITVLFIPQCVPVQNQFFLYQSHSIRLLKAITDMKKRYKV